MPNVERECVPYQVGRDTFDHLFFCVDGIYPPWARFLKTISAPMNPKQVSFSKWQEGTRKDIERGFGQLQGAFRIVANPIFAMKLARVSNIVLSCVILHNMRVEEYVSGRNNFYKPDDGIDVEPLDESFAGYGGKKLDESNKDTDAKQTLNDNEWLKDYLEEWNKLTNHFEHKRLQDAVIEQVHSFRL
jgi:hypothetical protein